MNMLFDKLFAKKKPEPPKPEPIAEPEPIREPEMTVRVCGNGKRVNYSCESYGTTKLQWISVEQIENGEPKIVRTPEESTKTFPLAFGFTAAGKDYVGLTQLFAQTDQHKTWCKDIYGREVLYLAKRFPCFDSDDFATENRFYRWFFLREGNKLTRVHYRDEDFRVYVTEDVENLEDAQWKEMQSLGYFRTPDNADDRSST